jgi:hypothetical protein
VVFSLRIFTLLGFNSHWIHLIHQCLSSVQFLYLIRWFSTWKILLFKRLRQGDPLSPFLLSLVLKLFLDLIHLEESKGAIYMALKSAVIVHLSLIWLMRMILFSSLKPRLVKLILFSNVLRNMRGGLVNLSTLLKSSLFFSKNTKDSIISSIKIFSISSKFLQKLSIWVCLFFHNNKTVLLRILSTEFWIEFLVGSLNCYLKLGRLL